MQGTKRIKPGRPVVRKSVSLPSRVASEVDRLARLKRTSSNQVIVGLIEQGIEARERERERFQYLTQQLIESRSEAERKALKEELARLTFG